MKAMSALESAYERCRSRLQKDDLGATLWGYLCAALFLIALTLSMLGCAGAPLSPRVEGMMGAGASSAGSAGVGESIGGAPVASPIASLTVRF
jgi:hypothetical protein